MPNRFPSSPTGPSPSWQFSSGASGASVAFNVAMAERKAKLGGIVERSSNAEARANTETLGSWRLDFGMIWNVVVVLGLGYWDRKNHA